MPPIDLAGKIIGGRYRIVGVIAQGGVGTIYEAEAVESGQKLAVKVLRRGPDADSIERFTRETTAAAELSHPNIVESIESVAESDTMFLVMELVRGPSVRDLIDRAELTARRTLVIARQVLDAVAHMHGKRIVHRDLKPENIMVTQVGFDRVKLVDFGLIKVLGDAAHGGAITRTGLVFGTPAYMSPEQALGQPVDTRSDLYSNGVVIFEMLTGRTPFRSPDPTTLVRMHASAPPPTLASVAPGQAWCTPALEALIAHALVKDPGARFATAEAMIDALDAAFVSLDHLP
jgi:serine/threonine-protein kinase